MIVVVVCDVVCELSDCARLRRKSKHTHTHTIIHINSLKQQRFFELLNVVWLGMYNASAYARLEHFLELVCVFVI